MYGSANIILCFLFVGLVCEGGIIFEYPLFGENEQFTTSEKNIYKPIVVSTKRPSTTERNESRKPSRFDATLIPDFSGGFTFTDENLDCQVSKEMGIYKSRILTCNGKTCLPYNKEYYICKEEMKWICAINLSNMKASCRSERRSIFPKGDCPEGQKMSHKGDCRPTSLNL